MQQQPTTKLFLGNLSSNVTREILYEIGIQAGPVTSCVIPLEADKRPKSFGFIVRLKTVDVVLIFVN